MLQNAIKSFLRNFNKRRLIYSITIGGFALSMAILLLIITFIIDEKSFDASYENIDKIYRIKQSQGNISVPIRSLQKILDEIPEVEKMAIFKSDEMIYEYAEEKRKAEIMQVSSMYFDIFSVKVLQGTIPEEFESKSDIIVTESFFPVVNG